MPPSNSRSIAHNGSVSSPGWEAGAGLQADSGRAPAGACIRVALVGVSGYARWHLMMLAEQALFGRAKLVAATVINQSQEVEICRRLRAHGVPLFSDYREMLAKLAGQADLVLLPTAIHWHTPMVQAALAAGLHVLVEKPAAATLQEVDRMAGMQQQTGRLVAVGFQDLYVPQTHAIKSRLLAGEIGALRRIAVTVHWPRPCGYYSRNDWAGRLQVGGAWVLDSPINNACAHFLMLALFWAGTAPAEAAQVAAVQAELYRAHSIESFDTVNLRLITATGVQIDFYATHCGTEDRTPEIVLTGNRGEIRWSSERQYTVARPGGMGETHSLTDHLMTKLHVMENVIGRLRGEASFVVDLKLAREHTRVVDAVHEYFPIHQVGEPAVTRVVDSEATFIRLAGIDEAMRRAAAAGLMLGETGVSWAKPAAPVSMHNYANFSGTHSSLSAAAS
jgi:predicted dehydrogenase